MAQLDTRQKLEILADAAKYDASCASSGTAKRNSQGRQGHRLDRGHGHLPRLCARRPLHLAAQDPADQQLHLRLPLLHQPQELERPPRALHRRRRSSTSRSPSTGATISRGCSSRRASSARSELHDGAAGRGRADRCARIMIFAATSISRRSPTPIPSWSIRPGSMPIACRSTSSCRPIGGLKRLAPEKDRAADRRRDGRC